MSLPEIKYCPSTLQPGFTTYSPAAQLALFGSRSRKVSHILSFGPPGKNAALTREYNEMRKTISISGVQEKYSLLQEKNNLKLTAEKGTHILKPVPSERLERIEDMPANEHVTMQIARQLFNIETAACGMIFFDEGSSAYITKRVDYKPDGTKYQVEDFATLLGKSPEREGNDFKYNASYADLAGVINKYVPASRVVLINFFRIVVFNYLFANGDAHLKNFALMESEQGDYLLAPAYDLLCTALHIDDGNLALNNGLYEGDMDEPSYRNYGMYTRQSFMAFAEKIGVQAAISEKIIDASLNAVLPATELIDRSFLSKEAKEKYKDIVGDRYRRFRMDVNI
jgi:serine/threonine-protein kinase HipA